MSTRTSTLFMPKVKYLIVNKKERKLDYYAREKESLPRYFCHDFPSYTKSNNDSFNLQLDIKR